MEGIQLHEVIGKGAFGTVHRGTSTDGKSVAVKVVHLAAFRQSDAAAEEKLMREVTVMEGLKHSNILELLCWRKEGDTLSMVLELLSGPDVQQVLNARGAFTEPEGKTITRQIVGALLYLHDLGIIHRDLKPANVMLVAPVPDLRTSGIDECQVKLLDFGVARRLCTSVPVPRQRSGVGRIFSRDKVTKMDKIPAASDASDSSDAPSRAITMVGTRGFAPPEITIAREPGATAVTMNLEEAKLIDAFALGKMMRYMLTGVSPDKSIMEAIEEQTLCGCIAIGKKLRIVESSRLSDPARELMGRLSEPQADKRMGLQEASGHEWLAF